MKNASNIPIGATNWVRSVFSAVNKVVSGTLSRLPNHYESALDMQLIAALDQAPPITDVAGWTVYLETHFLGGRKHFYNWEVADIGLLIIFRNHGQTVRIKTGLLQSKRLYPREAVAITDGARKTRIGFGSLLHNQEEYQRLVTGRTFTFDDNSAYEEISLGSDQHRALEGYQRLSGIPVYYLLYNPVTMPWSVQVPASSFAPLPELSVGCRVIRCDDLHTQVAAKGEKYSPSYQDTRSLGGKYHASDSGGWRLENFVADQLMGCKQGHVANEDTDHVLEKLFYQRSGPISAAIAVTIDAPEGVELVLPDAS